MNAPSNANTSGLENAGHIVWWKAGGVNYYPEGEAFTVSESCRVEPLVTAASAQAAIDGWVRWADEKLQEAQAETLNALAERDAAEARADRLAQGIVSVKLILTPEPGDAPLTEREKQARQLLAALQQETQK